MDVLQPDAEPVKHGDGTVPNELVLGQAYKESAGHYIFHGLKTVDGTKTFTGWEARTPYNWYVRMGEHEFTVLAMYGNFLTSLKGDQAFTGELKAGRV